MWDYSMNYGAVDQGPYLAHHGILGQKWGVRRFQNRDGTLTEEGRKRYSSSSEQKKLANKLTSKNADPYASLTRRSANRIAISSTPQVKHAVRRVKELSQRQIDANKAYEKALDRDFFNNKEVHNEWVNKAVDKYIEKYGDTLNDPRYYSYIPNSLKGKGPREFVRWMYEHDDWDQGDCGSLEMFLESKDPRNRNILKAQQASHDADRAMGNATRELVNEFLGEYANKKAQGTGYRSTAGIRLGQIISDDARYSNLSFSDKTAYPKKMY